MREILFKAKTKLIVDTYNSGKEDGEWVGGSLWIDTGKYAIKQFEFDRADYVDYEVAPETVCEYTGLKDCEGNPIFEGDIICCHGDEKQLLKVTFGEFDVINTEILDTIDHVIGWYTEVIPTDSISKMLPFCLNMPLNNFYIEREEMEIIGNIFDNLELLNGD